MDTDGDGLPDFVEEVIGTDPSKYSTAGDGISDGAKVAQGLDPLSGIAFPTGIIANLPLTGEAKEVALEGSVTNSTQQTAYVAAGSGGLAIVNASQFQKPVLLSRLPLPGDAADVSVDSNLQIAVVAANSGGLHFVNVSDPLNPALLRTLSLSVTQVEVVDGIAYAAVGPQLYSYDLLTGERLQVLSPGSATITGLAREGSILYSMDASRVLRAIDIGGANTIARGSLTMPAGGGKIFAAGGIVIVAAEAGFTGGFATANVSNPNALVLLSGVDAVNIAGKMVVANGSGLAIAVGSPGALGNLLEVLNFSDPANTGAFITQFTLPAAPYSVAIGSGIAFVTAGTAGLQVVNYRSFDNQGVAPTVSVNTTGMDVDSTKPGIQVVEGSLVSVSVQTADDVQVRNVELLLNGQVVQNDVTFPFDLKAAVPTLAPGATTATVQVRATDTGGNIGFSTLLTLELVRDTIAPTLVSVDPINNSARGLAFRTVTLRFSEPLDTSTATTANIQLLGPSGAVAPQTIQVRRNGATVQLTYPALATGSYQIVLNAPAVKDRAGNALGTANVTSTFTIKQATASWASTIGGFWDVAANWDGGQVPGPADDVLINIPGGGSVTFRSGSAIIRSLVSDSPFILSGGTLNVATTLQANASFTMSGGTIVGGTIVASGGSSLDVARATSGTLNGVTLASDMTVLTGGQLNIANGLTFSNNAKLTLAHDGSFGASTSLYANGTQTIGGTGEVIFGGPGASNGILARDGTQATPTVLTIGSGVTVHGGQGSLGGGTYDSVLNLGTISADTASKTITLVGNWSNQGTLQAINGGVLSLTGTWTNTGTIIETNSTLNLGGTFRLFDLGTLTRTGGTVNITGTLNNAGTTLALNATTGPWQLTSGTIIGGTITGAGGASLSVAGTYATLDGVTLGSDLTVLTSGELTLRNGLTLSNNAKITLAHDGSFGATTYLNANGTQVIGGTGEVVFAGPGNSNLILVRDGTQATPTVLTIGSGVTVHGGQGFIGGQSTYDSVLNLGTISADTAGQTITLNKVTNQGTLWASAGTLSLSNFAPNAGVMRAGGGGTVAINGALEAGAGTVSIDLGGTAANQFGHLSVTGAATLSGTLNLAATGGFDPALGATFPFLTCASRTGQWTTVNGNTGTGKQFTVSYTPTTATATVAAAPAPSGIVVAPASSSGSSNSSGSSTSASTGTATVPQISSVKRSGDGASFQFSTIAGRKYRLEGCDDLASGQWTLLLDHIDGTGEVLQVLDPVAAIYPRYFYRIILLP